MSKTKNTIDEMLTDLKEITGRIVDNDKLWKNNSKSDIRMYIRDELRRAHVPMPQKD